MRRIEAKKDHLFVEYNEAYGLEGVIGLMREASEACRREHLTKVLVDLRVMPGKISILDRFRMGVAGAEAFRGLAQVAVVYRKEEMNWFAETVGVNRGANVRVFGDLNDAKGWLGLK